MLRIWSTNQGGAPQPLHRIWIDSPISCLALDDDLIVVGTSDGHVQLYRVQNPQGQPDHTTWKGARVANEPIGKARLTKNSIFICLGTQVLLSSRDLEQMHTLSMTVSRQRPISDACLVEEAGALIAVSQADEKIQIFI